MGVIRWEQNVKNKKKGHSVTGGLKMGVNVAAHTRHIFLGSAPPPRASHPWSSSQLLNYVWFMSSQFLPRTGLSSAHINVFIQHTRSDSDQDIIRVTILVRPIFPLSQLVALCSVKKA